MDRERSSRRRVDEEEDRGSRRSRDDDRGSRDRDDDRGSSRRSSRDDDDRGSRSRDRDDDRGSSRRGGGSSYQYEERSKESVRQRSDSNGSDYDKFLNSRIKMWKPKDGDNRIRILPPTWKKPEHFGYDIYVHYGVGADRQTYLCLHKMKGEADPINEERERFAKEMDADNDKDKEYLRELTAQKRVLVYLIDRDNEKAGVMAYAMPKGMDLDIIKVSQDKATGEVLAIDHPEDGYDVTFEKRGTGKNTKYEGVAIARRSSPLGKDEWMEFAMDNPLPDQLIFYPYEHISKAFGGKGSHSGGGDRDDRGSRDRDESRGRDREERFSDGKSDARDERRGGSRDRDRDDRGSSKKDDALTWESIHDMTKAELRDLIDQESLKIDPGEAKDTEDLADWICDEMGLKKKSRREEPKDDPDLDDRLQKMRDRRRD